MRYIAYSRVALDSWQQPSLYVCWRTDGLHCGFYNYLEDEELEKREESFARRL